MNKITGRMLPPQKAIQWIPALAALLLAGPAMQCEAGPELPPSNGGNIPLPPAAAAPDPGIASTPAPAGIENPPPAPPSNTQNPPPPQNAAIPPPPAPAGNGKHWEELILRVDAWGHYRTRGKINGKTVKFLVDTGATTVAIPESMRGQLNLARGESHPVSTASDTFYSASTKIDELQIGPFHLKGIEGSLNPKAQNDEILLGMTALQNFEMKQKDGILTLRAEVEDEPALNARFSDYPKKEETINIKRSVRDCFGERKVIDQKALECMKGN